MESMLPDDTKNPSRGRPNSQTEEGSVQSGWQMTPTRKPWASSMRDTMAMPNEEWSM